MNIKLTQIYTNYYLIFLKSSLEKNYTHEELIILITDFIDKLDFSNLLNKKHIEIILLNRKKSLLTLKKNNLDNLKNYYGIQDKTLKTKQLLVNAIFNCDKQRIVYVYNMVKKVISTYITNIKKILASIPQLCSDIDGGIMEYIFT